MICSPTQFKEVNKNLDNILSWPENNFCDVYKDGTENDWSSIEYAFQCKELLDLKSNSIPEATKVNDAADAYYPGAYYSSLLSSLSVHHTATLCRLSV
jgi:hypothetical protein